MVSPASKILNTNKIKDKILDSLTGDLEVDSLLEDYLKEDDDNLTEELQSLDLTTIVEKCLEFYTEEEIIKECSGIIETPIQEEKVEAPKPVKAPVTKPLLPKEDTISFRKKEELREAKLERVLEERIGKVLEEKLEKKITDNLEGKLKGEPGPRGPSGGGMGKSFKWQSDYLDTKKYLPRDVVFYEGSSYICLKESKGNLPSVVSYWDLMASRGEDGSVEDIDYNLVIAYSIALG